MFRPQRFNILPPIVKNLLIINTLFFFATITLTNQGLDLRNYLGLHHWQSNDFQTWQIITHMFMHGNFTHLFFNMFAIWMFGTQLENLWGSKRFLNYYILTGLGAAFLHFVIFTTRCHARWRHGVASHVASNLHPKKCIFYCVLQ